MAIVNEVQERRFDFDHSAVLFDEPKLLELAHEEVHAGACGADHFRDDLLRDLRQHTSARAPLIATGKHEQRARQALLAGLEDLISHIGLEVGVTRDDVRDKSIRNRWMRAEQPNHLPLGDDEHLRGGNGGRGLPPDGMPAEHLLAQERAGPQQTADRLLPAARRHGQPDTALLDLYHALARVTL